MSHTENITLLAERIRDEFNSLRGVVNSISSGGSVDSFETFSKNLKAYNKTTNLNTNGDIGSQVFTLGGGLQITKNYNYLPNGDIDTIVLSGDIPNNINTTKTYSYNGNTIDTTYS